MDKCNWEDSKFEACEKFNGIIYWRDFGNNKEYICSQCHTNILKPEEEKPLIVKSGETVVVNWGDRDLLCVMPHPEWRLKDYKLHFINNMHDRTRYKPFSEIELTDEIAKLRPMINLIDTFHNETEIKILTYIDNDLIQCRGFIYIKKRNTHIDFRLATPQELKESE